MSIKPNYKVVSELIKPNSKVLDLGCGDGSLLKMLHEVKNVTGVGIEIDQHMVLRTLEKGLSVIQDDIDEGLKAFRDKEYDYVILNQTLQSTEKPDYVMDEMLRVGKKAVVSFPNFGYWKVRIYLLFKGKMPKSERLPYEWYNTPNIHLLTIKDFYEFCDKRNIKIEKAIFLTKSKRTKFLLWDKINCDEAVFIVSRN